MDAGEGYDILKVSDAPAAIEVNLSMNYSKINSISEVDQVFNFEAVIGSAYNDDITGNDVSNWF